MVVNDGKCKWLWMKHNPLTYTNPNGNERNVHPRCVCVRTSSSSSSASLFATSFAWPFSSCPTAAPWHTGFHSSSSSSSSSWSSVPSWSSQPRPIGCRQSYVKHMPTTHVDQCSTSGLMTTKYCLQCFHSNMPLSPGSNKKSSAVCSVGFQSSHKSSNVGPAVIVATHPVDGYPGK